MKDSGKASYPRLYMRFDRWFVSRPTKLLTNVSSISLIERCLEPLFLRVCPLQVWSCCTDLFEIKVNLTGVFILRDSSGPFITKVMEACLFKNSWLTITSAHSLGITWNEALGYWWSIRLKIPETLPSVCIETSEEAIPIEVALPAIGNPNFRTMSVSTKFSSTRVDKHMNRIAFQRSFNYGRCQTWRSTSQQGSRPGSCSHFRPVGGHLLIRVE